MPCIIMPSPYEKDVNIKRNFSYSDVIIMINMLNNQKKLIHASKLAKDMGHSPSRLNQIIKYFKELEIIKDVEKMGSNKMIQINYSLLKHFIDEQDVLIWLVENYLGKYNTYRYKDY